MVLTAHCPIITPVTTIYTSSVVLTTAYRRGGEGGQACKDTKYFCVRMSQSRDCDMSQKPTSGSLFCPTTIFFQWTEKCVLQFWLKLL